MAFLVTTWCGGAPPGFSRLGRLGLGMAILLLLAGTEGRAQTSAYREYQVKAVFLFNFTQFVDWPAVAFPDDQSPLTIGVLGEDPFGVFLDETVRDEKINRRSIVIRRYRHVEEVGSCQVLFISRSESHRLERILAALKGRSILTVGDEDSFARRGGMIGFVPANNHTRLQINLGAAKVAGLTISSKLLRPAEIVTEAN